jgi:hypothetical protein
MNKIIMAIVGVLLFAGGFVAGDVYTAKEMKTHIHSRTIQVWEP